MRFVVVAVAAVAAALVPVIAAARPLTIPDMARIVNVEEPAISPDARHIAIVTYRIDLAHATNVPSLQLVETATGATRTLLRDRDVSVPRWSPGGACLAYLATANAQLQVFSRCGAATMQLTRAPYGVTDFAWSPDGRHIAFVAPDPPANAAALAAHHDYFFAGNNEYTATALTPPSHLWLVATRSGKAHRLTQGTWTIAPTDPGGIFSPQIAWNPPGTRIAFARVATTWAGEDEYSTIWDIAAAGGTPRKLTDHSAFELSPSYARDGTLAYWYPRGGNFLAENTLRALSGGADVQVAADFDRNVAGALWYPDGRTMFVCASDRARVGAWNLDVAAGTLHPLPMGSLNVVCDPYSSSTFDAGAAASIARDGTIAFVATDAAHPRDLYVLAPHAAAPRRLTHFADALAGVEPGRMTEITWTGPGAFAEDGIVTYPPGFDATHAAMPGRTYPVVVFVHGGPGLSNDLEFSWEQWPLAQEIAARGYIVLQANYRGSDNLGNAYMLAIAGDTAAGPAGDVMAGLAELEKQPYVDSSRIAVCGWSYGGLLTTWLIGHDRRWKAAISGAAVNDETEEYNLSISNVQNRYYLGTSPYVGNGPRIYAEQSPISYYNAIVTPTLIWGTTQDPVVPITQSYALYHALTDNHVPVRFLVFPAGSHGPETPVQEADLTHFWLTWLTKYL